MIMTSSFAIPTGAQFTDGEMVLTFDVLVIDPTLDYENTYFASVVSVQSGDTPEEIRLKVSEQILTDCKNFVGIELQPQSLTIPAYFKGIVGPDFEYPVAEEPVDEEPPAEEPPAEEPPADPNA